jgi:hypothetical protein
LKVVCMSGSHPQHLAQSTVYIGFLR